MPDLLQEIQRIDRTTTLWPASIRHCPVRFPAALFCICFLASALLSSLGVVGFDVTAGSPGDDITVVPCGYGGGGRFTSIEISPEDSRVMFIGSDVAGVFKSTDQGRSFQLKGKGLEGFSVADILIHPVDISRMFLLTADGLYGSLDGGESWKKENGTVRYGSRLFGSRLMVLSGNSLWVAADRAGVFQIRVEDSPWLAVAAPGLEGTKVNALAGHGETIYAGTERGVFFLANGKWQPCNEGLPPDHKEMTDLLVHSQGRIYALEKNSGLYVWDEERKKWKGLGPDAQQRLSDRAGGFKAMSVHPGNPDIVFVATHPETWPYILYKSIDAGKSWKKIASFKLNSQASENYAGSLNAVERIAFCPSDPKRLVLTDWWNVWESQDEGESWVQLHKGLQNTVINAVKVPSPSMQTIFLAAMDNGLMVSNDGGNRWKRKMSGVVDGHAQTVEISRRDPSKMYLLMNPWSKKDRVFVYKSSNGGETWEDISFPLPAMTLPRLGFVDGLATNLVLDPGCDDILYVGTNGYGVFKTINGGKTWQTANRGLRTPYIRGPNALLIHPGNSKIIYASTLQGGVFKTLDGGDNWMAVSKQYPFTFGMAMDPSNPSRLLAGRPEKKIIISEDDGQSWKEIALPGGNPANIASYAVAVHPLDPSVVVIGTLAYEKAADGVYVSSDGCKTFSKVPMDLPLINILAIEIVKRPELSFFVGFNGIGAYLCERPRVSN